MNRWHIALCLTSLVGAAGCLGEVYTDPASGTMDSAQAALRPEPPARYRNLHNPMRDSLEAALVGQTLYQQHCADCHGNDGRGDGPLAAGMSPAASSFYQIGEPTDGYLFWRIREGGGVAPFDSDMPAYKDQMEDSRVWEIVSYVRLFYEQANPETPRTTPAGSTQPDSP